VNQNKKFRCSKCKKIKIYKDFYLSKGQPNSWCKSCFKQDHRDKYKPKSGYSDEARNCLECNQRYSPSQRRKSIFCSRLCKDKYRRQQLKISSLNSKKVRACIACNIIIPKTARADKKYCSEECSSKLRGRTMNVERRIRTSEPVLHFKRVDIYERDNWTCQLCLTSVNPNLAFPDPMCASLDHVIPLSRGGSHQSSNVQLAHLRCNTSRGNKVEGLSPRPAIVLGNRKVYTLSEASEMLGTTNSILQTAVVNKKIPSIQKEKYGTRYLESYVVNDLILTGVPGSLEWRRKRNVIKNPVTKLINCKYCRKKIIVSKGMNSPRRYCSTICYRNQRNTERQLNPSRLDSITCAVCRKGIKGRKQVKKVNLCSQSCVNQWRSKRQKTALKINLGKGRGTERKTKAVSG
jgi:HNH endonuclease